MGERGAAQQTEFNSAERLDEFRAQFEALVEPQTAEAVRNQFVVLEAICDVLPQMGVVLSSNVQESLSFFESHWDIAADNAVEDAYLPLGLLKDHVRRALNGEEPKEEQRYETNPDIAAVELNMARLQDELPQDTEMFRAQLQIYAQEQGQKDTILPEIVQAWSVDLAHALNNGDIESMLSLKGRLDTLLSGASKQQEIAISQMFEEVFTSFVDLNAYSFEQACIDAWRDQDQLDTEQQDTYIEKALEQLETARQAIHDVPPEDIAVQWEVFLQAHDVALSAAVDFDPEARDTLIDTSEAEDNLKDRLQDIFDQADQLLVVFGADAPGLGEILDLHENEAAQDALSVEDIQKLEAQIQTLMEQVQEHTVELETDILSMFARLKSKEKRIPVDIQDALALKGMSRAIELKSLHTRLQRKLDREQASEEFTLLKEQIQQILEQITIDKTGNKDDARMMRKWERLQRVKKGITRFDLRTLRQIKEYFAVHSTRQESDSEKGVSENQGAEERKTLRQEVFENEHHALVEARAIIDSVDEGVEPVAVSNPVRGKSNKKYSSDKPVSGGFFSKVKGLFGRRKKQQENVSREQNIVRQSARRERRGAIAFMAGALSSVALAVNMRLRNPEQNIKQNDAIVDIRYNSERKRVLSQESPQNMDTSTVVSKQTSEREADRPPLSQESNMSIERDVVGDTQEKNTPRVLRINAGDTLEGRIREELIVSGIEKDMARTLAAKSILRAPKELGNLDHIRPGDQFYITVSQQTDGSPYVELLSDSTSIRGKKKKETGLPGLKNPIARPSSERRTFKEKRRPNVVLLGKEDRPVSPEPVPNPRVQRLHEGIPFNPSTFEKDGLLPIRVEQQPLGDLLKKVTTSELRQALAHVAPDPFGLRKEPQVEMMFDGKVVTSPMEAYAIIQRTDVQVEQFKGQRDADGKLEVHRLIVTSQS